MNISFFLISKKVYRIQLKRELSISGIVTPKVMKALQLKVHDYSPSAVNLYREILLSDIDSEFLHLVTNIRFAESDKEKCDQYFLYIYCLVALVNNKSPTQTEACIRRNIESTEVAVKLFDVVYGNFVEKILPRNVNNFHHMLK